MTLIEMARRFHALASPPWPLDETAFAELLAGIEQTGFLRVEENGFIAGVIVENPLSPKWLIAKEFLWWSADGGGLRLASAFRRWAKARGASEIQWSCPPNAQRARALIAKRAEMSELVFSEYV